MLPVSEWQRVKPWIESALKYTGGTHTIEDIEASIQSGQAFLLAGEKSAMVCEIWTYPQKKVLLIFLAGGDLNELRSRNDQVDEIARSFGCSAIRIIGRKGFERAIADLGYRPAWVTLTKEL